MATHVRARLISHTLRFDLVHKVQIETGGDLALKGGGVERSHYGELRELNL